LRPARSASERIGESRRTSTTGPMPRVACAPIALIFASLPAAKMKAESPPIPLSIAPAFSASSSGAALGNSDQMI
jgi:hypothetical protein